MAHGDLDNTADFLDVRDIVARVEELREFRDSPRPGVDTFDADEAAELATLESLLADLRGNGGDEQWEGDWYPVTLLRDSYFEEAMDELLEDIGAFPRDLPCYLKVTVDYDALKIDYTSVEYDGVTYWYR